MEIPLDTLSLLSCVECGAVLSRGPVFQAHDGAALCDRCVRADRPTSRNQVYEAVAQLLRFPCKNRELGCTYTVPFTLNNEDVAHEVACPYRQYLCPVVPRGECEWLGTRREMLEHCEAEHPDSVVRNGVQLTHNITKSSQNTYLLYAFHILFLLHTKVCVVTGKIFHSLRLFGDPDNASKFSFTLDVKRGKYLISMPYQVAPPGSLAMQEDSSLAMSINSLLEILNVFEGTTFTVTVYDETGCIECRTELKQYYYLDGEGWLCESCAPVKRSCINKNKGCVHSDIDEKCEKHEMFSCLLSTLCHFCNKTVTGETLIEHYTSAHGEITHASGSTWRNTFKNDKSFLISTEVGLIRCRSWPETNDSHRLSISSSLLCSELHELHCEIILSHPTTKQSKTYNNCNILYNVVADWRLQVSNNDFMCENGQYDICITISRVVT